MSQHVKFPRAFNWPWPFPAAALAPLLLAAPCVDAQPAPTAREIANRVETRYQKLRTMQVTFLERYRQGKNVRVESGTAYFSRPGRMRWEYEAPEEKLFLVDGRNAWFYVPADRTATRAKVQESDNWHTPVALLAGKLRPGVLSRLCGILETQPVRAGHALRCVPKDKQASFREMLLEMDDDFRLARIVIREAGDVETEFRFADWQENVALAEVLFHFSAPKGVAIVEEQSIAGPSR
jgi:outer membrane lipoprotein carrier protein